MGFGPVSGQNFRLMIVAKSQSTVKSIHPKKKTVSKKVQITKVKAQPKHRSCRVFCALGVFIFLECIARRILEDDKYNKYCSKTIFIAVGNY